MDGASTTESDADATLPDRIEYGTSRVILGLLAVGFAYFMAFVVVTSVTGSGRGRDIVGTSKFVSLMLLLGAVAGVGLLRPLVVVTPSHLIVRRLFTTTSMPWGDITAMYAVSGALSVTSTSITVDIPRSFARRGGGAGSRALVDGVRRAWIERRGEDWTLRPLDPWEPTVDVHGRVVLRRPFGEGGEALASVWGWIVIMGGASEAMSPDKPITGGLAPLFVGSVIVGAFALFCHARLALVVTHDAVIVRDLFRSRRIPRTEVLGVAVDDVPAPLPRLGSPTRRMVLHTTAGPVATRAPASGGRVAQPDPLFYRKVAWLQRELRPAAVD